MSIGITVPAHGPATPVAALAACSVVNGFVNETWRNGRDGVRRGGMTGTRDCSRPGRLRLGKSYETATG
jgi:hypothetical protein